MNIPKIRFKEFKQEWKNYKLNEILTFENGLNASSEIFGTGYKFINVMDILNNENGIFFNEIIGKIDIEEKIFNKKSIKYGDIVFQRSSETKEGAGLSNVYLDKNKKCTFGGFIIHGKNRNIIYYNPLFMHNLLRTFNIRKDIIQKSSGFIRANVSQKSLSDIKLNLPEKEEQDKIADFISTIDTRTKQLKEKKELLLEYRKGILQQIFSKKIRFKDEDGNDFSDWKVKKLNEIAVLLNGYSFKTNIYNDNGKYKIISIKNVQKGKMNTNKSNKIVNLPSNIQSHQILNINDILISMTGDIGRVCLVNETNTLLNQRVGLIKPTNIEYDFLYIYLNSDDFHSKMILKGQGAAHHNIGKGDIESFILNIPSSKVERKKIANFIKSLDTKINQVEQQIEGNEEYKKGLLQRMFV